MSCLIVEGGVLPSASSRTEVCPKGSGRMGRCGPEDGSRPRYLTAQKAEPWGLSSLWKAWGELPGAPGLAAGPPPGAATRVIGSLCLSSGGFPHLGQAARLLEAWL